MVSTKSAWSHAKTFGITALLTGILSISLAACGGDTNPAPTNSTNNPTVQATTASVTTAPTIGKAAGQQVDIKLNEWSILPDNLTIPAGKVIFVVSNDGNATHNLAVQNAGSDVGKTPNFTKADGSKNLELDLQPGTYTLICTIPGHAQKGMKGTLTVSK